MSSQGFARSFRRGFNSQTGQRLRGAKRTVIRRINEKTRLESYHSYYRILIVEDTQPIVNTDKHLKSSYVRENILATNGVISVIPTALRARVKPNDVSYKSRLGLGHMSELSENGVEGRGDRNRKKFSVRILVACDHNITLFLALKRPRFKPRRFPLRPGVPHNLRCHCYQ